MTDTATFLMDPAAAPIFGLAGLTARLVSPLLQSRKAMLATQLCASFANATSYALLSQATATSVCLLGALQTSVALLAGEREWLGRMGYVFLPVVLGIGAITWSGLPTLFAVTACCLVMIGRLQRDMLRFRGIQLAASPFGAAHDICIGAWPCLISALVTFATALIGFTRELNAQKAAT